MTIETVRRGVNNARHHHDTHTLDERTGRREQRSQHAPLLKPRYRVTPNHNASKIKHALHNASHRKTKHGDTRRDDVVAI